MQQNKRTINDQAVNEAMAVSLRAIAAVKLAGEFYTKSERESEIAGYRALMKAHDEASDAWRSFPHPVEHYEQWVADEGKATADQRKAQWNAHMETTNKFRDSIRSFEKRHPLIVELFIAREAVCERDSLKRPLYYE